MDFNSPEYVISSTIKGGALTLEKHHQTCTMHFLCIRKFLQRVIPT
jgi:hypothetical protein